MKRRAQKNACRESGEALEQDVRSSKKELFGQAKAGIKKPLLSDFASVLGH